MLESTVNVEGTVKIDDSPFIETYLANARRAKEKEIGKKQKNTTYWLKRNYGGANK